MKKSMCGIFGIISPTKINKKELQLLAKNAKTRGQDSSGLIYTKDNQYQIRRADYSIDKLLKNVNPYDSPVVFGHSRLI
ncbi:MAG: glucosamine 6-phosphate synthetase, partial [Flavobacteriales bacterium]|nr:glucosamine 6-phosphate synthetase [Flavobacteriales bacterium]